MPIAGEGGDCTLQGAVRDEARRKRLSSAAIVDSQTVKTAEEGGRPWV